MPTPPCVADKRQSYRSARVYHLENCYATIVTIVTPSVTLHLERNRPHSEVTVRFELEGDSSQRRDATLGHIDVSAINRFVRVMGSSSPLFFFVPCVFLLACKPTYEMRIPREPVLATHANATDSATKPSLAAEPRPSLAPSNSHPDQVGLASWYGSSLAGRRTANGERFDPRQLTAAHRTLPFGTWVEVRRIDTGRVVRVRINDRGPNGGASARVIDLSQRAAEDLDILNEGVVRVELRVVHGPQ